MSDQALTAEEKRGRIVDEADAIFACHREPIATLVSEVVVAFIVEKRTPRIFVGDLADGVKTALVNMLASANGLGRAELPEVTFSAEVISLSGTPRNIDIVAGVGGRAIAVARIVA